MAKDRLSVKRVSGQAQKQDRRPNHSFQTKPSQNDIERFTKRQISLSQSLENGCFEHIEEHLWAREIWLCHTYSYKNKEENIVCHNIRAGRRINKSRGVNTIDYKRCKEQSSL